MDTSTSSSSLLGVGVPPAPKLKVNNFERWKNDMITYLSSLRLEKHLYHDVVGALKSDLERKKALRDEISRHPSGSMSKTSRLHLGDEEEEEEGADSSSSSSSSSSSTRTTRVSGRATSSTSSASTARPTTSIISAELIELDKAIAALEAEIETAGIQESRTKSALISALDDITARGFASKRTAREVWHTLCERYGKKPFHKFKESFDLLRSLQKGPRGDNDYMTVLSALDGLIRHEVDFAHGVLALFLYEHAPPRVQNRLFEEWNTMPLIDFNNTELDDLQRRYTELCINYTGQRSTESATALHILKDDDDDVQHANAANAQSNNANKKGKRWKCNYCKKTGHTADRCWKKRKEAEAKRILQEHKAFELHKRFGHVAPSTLKEVISSGAIDVNMNPNLLNFSFPCDGCLAGKMAQKPHGESKEDANISRPLELLSIDLCGPMPVRDFHHNLYFGTITDHYSRAIMVLKLRSKDQAPQDYIKELTRLERSTGYKIKTIRMDGGGEFKGELDKWM